MSSHNQKRYLAAAGVLALAAFSLAGCTGKKEENIISSELVSDEEGFGKDTAKTGDFVEEQTFDAKRDYPISNVITADYNGVRLKAVRVKANQSVKKGELLVEIEPVTAEILAQKEAAIAKNKEETDKVLASYQTSMDSLTQNIAVSQGTQQKLYQTELEKVRLQYAWYSQDAVDGQKELQAELEQLRSLQGDLNIYAPYDGVIDSISNIQAGTELTNAREILSMHSEEQILLSVSQGARLRYGQEVTVETGSGDHIKRYKGVVISADNVRSDALKNGAATIRLQDTVSADELSNVRVKASTKELHNVLVVKNYAVSEEKDKNYISIIDGDRIMKRQILTGGSCGEYTWILQGLNEGQSVTIQ